MQAFAGLLMLLLMGVFLVAFAGLFVRIPKVGLTSRKRAGLGMAGAFLGVVLLAIAVPSDPETPSPAMSMKAGPAAPSPGPSEAEAAAKTKAELELQADALWEGILATLGPCDRYVSTATEVLSQAAAGRASVADAYKAAKDGKSACTLVYSDMGTLKPPAAAKGEVRDGFENAIKECRDVALVRQMAMESLGTYLDGDHRPSSEVKVKEELEAGGPQVLRCMVQYYAATEKAGVTLKSFKDPAEKAKAAAASK